MGIEIIVTILPYALLGAIVKIIWGIYKAYTMFLSLRINYIRILVEVIVSVFFGIFGGIVLSELKVFTIGVNLGTLVSGLLGAYVVDLITKKFGLSQKMQVIVSDQQLGLGDLNPRQVNAIDYARKEGKITNKIYQRINQTTINIAKHELNNLVRKGKLMRHGSTKDAYYTIT